METFNKSIKEYEESMTTPTDRIEQMSEKDKEELWKARMDTSLFGIGFTKFTPDGIEHIPFVESLPERVQGAIDEKARIIELLGSEGMVEDMAESMMATYLGLDKMPEYKKAEQKKSEQYGQCVDLAKAALAVVLEKVKL